MIDHPRRRLLQAGLAAATGSLLPPSIARAAAIGPDVRTGTLEDLQHIVILMQENRSFDHYFGTLPGVRGFGDRFPIPAPPLPNTPPRTVWLQPSQDGSRLLAPFPLATARQFGYMRVEGTPHSWPDAQQAWDHGRMGHWTAAKHNHALAHFSREDLPFQFALAENFTLCDAYHCAIQAGTNPNRIFQWTGQNDPHAEAGGPAIANSHDNFPELKGFAESYRWTTYVESLQAAGVSWQVYQDMEDNFTDNPLAGFERFRSAWSKAPGHDAELRARGVSTRGLVQLREDALADKLPAVSFVIADAAGSEHPSPSSPAQGAAYTARVIDALTANAEVWSRTALLLNFDENDGFFDHVPPPAPPSPDPGAPQGWAGASAIDTRGEYHLHPAPGDEALDPSELRGRPYGLGPRVPMYVISPWSRGGWVDSQVYDHTSPLRLIERRFGVTASGISAWRRAVCGDLTAAFDFRQSDLRPFFASLPETTRVAARAAALAERALPALPETLQPPQQARGTRPSRPVPYRLLAQVLAGKRTSDRVTLALANPGAAAVVHVYDLLDLEAIPRRYTLAGAAPQHASWALHEGRYDLWLLGPNGFHRHFRGHADAPVLHASLNLDASDPGLFRLVLGHDGERPVRIKIQPGAYADAMPTLDLVLQPDQSHEHLWPAVSIAGWYDLWLLQDDGNAQRLAGRVETGKSASTDPALGGPARLYQQQIFGAAGSPLFGDARAHDPGFHPVVR